LDLVSAEVISFDGKTVDEALAREAGRTLASARARGLSRQLIPRPPCDEGDNVMEAILPAYKAVGERRYRETSGLYWEDFEPGDVFEHRPGRTVLDVDNTTSPC
jgi:hypothetical protein